MRACMHVAGSFTYNVATFMFLSFCTRLIVCVVLRAVALVSKCLFSSFGYCLCIAPFVSMCFLFLVLVFGCVSLPLFCLFLLWCFSSSSSSLLSALFPCSSHSLSLSLSLSVFLLFYLRQGPATTATTHHYQYGYQWEESGF